MVELYCFLMQPNLNSKKCEARADFALTNFDILSIYLLEISYS